MPDVGDWLEGHEGTLNNPLGEIHNGLMGQGGWQWQWYRENDPIAGETDRLYQVQVADVGSRIRVETNPIDQFLRETGIVSSAFTDPVT